MRASIMDHDVPLRIMAANKIGSGTSDKIHVMSSQSTEQHRQIAAKQGPVKVAIITVSDTRTRRTTPAAT